MSCFKQKAENNKIKIIKKDTKNFKKLCLKEFLKNIANGIDVTYIDFCGHVDRNFESEISEKVLNELKEERQDIEFSFCYRHYMNSYKGIKMEAK